MIKSDIKRPLPKPEKPRKKLVAYGLVGTVLVAAASYGGYSAYQTRSKHQDTEKEKKALEIISSVKPSTFDAVKLEAKYPAEKSDVLDWSKINPKSEMVRKILTALQSKDDVTLGLEDFDYIIHPLSNPYGFHYEPPEDESNARVELFEIIRDQPALALELAEARKRSRDPDFYVEWIVVAFENGSKKALNTYIDIQKKERAYSQLVDLFVGQNGEDGEVVDLPKAAEYFGLAIQAGDAQVGNNSQIVDKILSNGPKVASAAREMLLIEANSPPIGNPSDLLKACEKSSIDIIDPINYGQVVEEKPGSDDEIRLCKSALFFNKNSKDLWYQYGYALHRNGQWSLAKIAYARSAELGSPIAIARFWWIDFPVNQKRSVEMLQAEAKNGNPWGDYFQGIIYGGTFKEALDYKKAEQSYLKAVNAGITYANWELVKIYIEQKQYDLAVKSLEKASEKFPTASLALGQVYESGEWGKKDLELAKNWLTKAADQGVEEAKVALARLEEATVASSVASGSAPLPLEADPSDVYESHDVRFTLRNNSSETICYVYASSSHKKTWGDNLLPWGTTRGAILPRFAYEFVLPSQVNCIFDIRAIACENGPKWIMKNRNLCKITSLGLGD